MQQYFETFTPRIQNSVRILTHALHTESDGSPYFLPWDVIDDFHNFLKNGSYIVYVDDGTVVELPQENTFTDLAKLDKLFHLVFVVTPAMPTINDNFLMRCTSMLSVDTSGLTNVTVIGKYFLFDSKSLTTFDTSGLTNVTTIDNGFLYDCMSLTSFDTSGLTNVTSIGNKF
eukprot:PhF_6_TR5115/c2_g2_i12/m.7244